MIPNFRYSLNVPKKKQRKKQKLHACSQCINAFILNETIESVPYQKFTMKERAYLSGVLDKLLPLRFELLSGGDVNFPVFIVIRDEELSIRELIEKCFRYRDGANCIQLLIILYLNVMRNIEVLKGVKCVKNVLKNFIAG